MPPPLILLLEEHRAQALKRVCAFFGIVSADHDTPSRTQALQLLRPYLLRLSANDVERLGDDASELARLLTEERSLVKRDRIIARWSSSAVSVPRFAQTLLGALGDDLSRHPELEAKIRVVLLPVAIQSVQRSDYGASALRELLASHYRDVFQHNPALTKAYQEDLAREALRREAWEREQQHREKETRDLDAQRETHRQARLAEITSLAFPERIELMLSGRTGVAGPFPMEWAVVSAHEVQALSSSVRLALIRALRAKRHKVYREIRRRLQSLYREEQARERSELAKSLDEMSLFDQLHHLATATVPVGKYPASLAMRASAEVLSIPSQLRARLLLRLVGQRRGIWRSLRDVLRREAVPERSVERM